MARASNPGAEETSHAIIKVQLWLSGAPGGPWPEYVDDPEASLSSRATVADTTPSTDGSEDESTTQSTDSGWRSQHYENRASQVANPEKRLSGPSSFLQHRPREAMLRMPHGNKPQSHHQQEEYLASVSKALLNIRVQYASSEEEDDPVHPPLPNSSLVDLKNHESSSSAYSSGAGEEEEERRERGRGPPNARATGPFSLRHLKRRTRAERAARNASWGWTVEDCIPRATRASTTAINHDPRAPNCSVLRSPVQSTEFKTPVFFVSAPTEENMPVVPEEFMALARQYVANECNDTELLVLDYVTTHRAVRQARERAAAFKKRKEGEQLCLVRALCRAERIHEEREEELVGLGAPRQVPGPRPPSSPGRGKKKTTFPVGQRRRAQKKSLGALKQRLVQYQLGSGAPYHRPEHQEERRPVPVVASTSTQGTPRDEELREQLSQHLVMPSTSGRASIGAELYHGPAASTLNEPEAVSDVDSSFPTEALNKSMSCEDAQRYFAPIFAEDTVAAAGVVSEDTRPSPADSTTPSQPCVYMTQPAIYELSSQQLCETGDQLSDQFRLVEAIAPMHRPNQAIQVDAGRSLDAGRSGMQPCNDDEFLSSLVHTLDDGRPSLRMKITRRPSVSSSGLREPDAETTANNMHLDVHHMY
ncbi:hypothetical protein QAD02_016784 [Eretmocerus hayati]|uniref:Uncharacterized protein n=1 Tax=Eretmocerus hayati TaxID=131215 RepID=A0ACC2PEX0_9HYME|nr:hypothetical protein QAD02_016784 [Eretmocerus hayati]